MRLKKINKQKILIISMVKTSANMYVIMLLMRLIIEFLLVVVMKIIVRL
jgi:hypothetical protein